MKWFCLSTAILLFVQLSTFEAKAQTRQEQSEPKLIIGDGHIADITTGLQFHKAHSIVGAKDVIRLNHNGEHVRMSPNGKFLLHNKYIIPLDDREVITFTDMDAYRCAWSPDGEKIVFYSNGIWMIPVSEETGRPTGPARKILEGEYSYGPHPCWSPDSKKIVFLSTNQQHLLVLSVDDGKLIQLTEVAQYYFPGDWSPDGKWIAYDQNGNSRWVIPSEGGEARKLADGKGRPRLKWSPDGKWVFYHMDNTLHFMRFSDGFTFDISTPEQIGHYVSRSQDDKKMLFYKCSYKMTDALKIMSASGGKPFGPEGLDLSAMEHYWSPDSQFVLSWGKHDDQWTYWIVPMTGEDAYPLRLDVPLEGELKCRSLSPDIRKLCFSQKLGQEEKIFWVAPISVKQGKTAGRPVNVFDQGKVSQLQWASDGSKLGFIHEEDFWIARSDGSESIRLTDVSDREIAAPHLSPDGSAVSWISYTPESKVSILRWQQMSESDSHDVVTSLRRLPYQWSPYGKRIVYWLYDGDDETPDEVFAFSLRDGESKKLVEGHIQFWAWSPSGDQLAVLTKEKLRVFNVEDGTTRDIEFTGKIDPLWDRAYHMQWSPDGQQIGIVAMFIDEDVTSLFTVSLLDGKWKEMTERQGTSYVFSWSPNGKWISYNLQELVKLRPAGSLWEVEIDEYIEKVVQTQRTD